MIFQHPPDLASVLLEAAWIVAIALAVTAVVIAYSQRHNADRPTTIDRLALVWLVASLCLVAMFTLRSPMTASAAADPQLNPITTVAVQDAVENLVLYLPVGFFAALVWRTRRHPVVWATGLSLAVAFSIESAQWILPINRAASVHDVLFNTFGGIVGATIGVASERVMRRSA